MNERRERVRGRGMVRLFSTRRVLSLAGVRDAAVIALALVLTGGVAFAVIEGVSLASGVWFTLNMVTTVGNPGYSAETLGGQLIAVLVMLVGIGFVAMVTAFIAERFIRVGRAGEAQDLMLSKLDAIERRLERLEGDRQR